MSNFVKGKRKTVENNFDKFHHETMLLLRDQQIFIK